MSLYGAFILAYLEDVYAGLLAGLVTALFSRALVILGSAVALSFHVRRTLPVCLFLAQGLPFLRLRSHTSSVTDNTSWHPGMALISLTWLELVEFLVWPPSAEPAQTTHGLRLHLL